jgi:hypothetical protein
MQGEKEKVRDTTEGSGQQQQATPRGEEPNPVGQDSARNEYGEIGEDTSSGSEPPRSLGTHGTEFGQFGERGSHGQQGQSGTGQADLGSQAGSTLTGRTDQQDLGELGGEVDQPGSFGATKGEGFILQQDSEPTGASSAEATEGTDFAPEGRGATEKDEESETGPRD